MFIYIYTQINQVLYRLQSGAEWLPSIRLGVGNELERILNDKFLLFMRLLQVSYSLTRLEHSLIIVKQIRNLPAKIQPGGFPV